MFINLKKKAFTLVELLVIIGITTTLALITLPILTSRVQGNDILETVKAINSQIIQQQQNAYSGKNSISYGIKFNTNDITLFQGNSYASSTNQEVYPFTNGITVSQINLTSGSEIVFNSGSFRPNVNGSINFYSNPDTYSITINSEGLVRYAKV